MIKSCEKETKKKEISPKSKKPAVYKKNRRCPIEFLRGTSGAKIVA